MNGWETQSAFSINWWQSLDSFCFHFPWTSRRAPVTSRQFTYISTGRNAQSRTTSRKGLQSVIPWIRGPRNKTAVRNTSERSERRNRTSGRMKSKPRSDELSPSYRSGTYSWSAQSQVTLWPHHTLKQQIWKHNNCTVGLEA